MVRQIIAGCAGNSQIIEDRVAKVPQVDPIKFESYASTTAFVSSHGKDDKSFHGYFNGFWCNFSQTPEERDHYNEHYRHLFKIKRAVLETTALREDQVVVRKQDHQVFAVEGDNL